MILVNNLSLIIIFYLIGSLPFALIFTKLFGFGDIRNIGSGNVGATNVLRTGNKFLAIVVLCFDIFKGFLPFLILKIYLQESHVPYLFENDKSKILYPPAKQLSDIIKYKATSVDLNDDGVNEVVAYTEGSLVCGSSGCTSYILQEIKGVQK